MIRKFTAIAASALLAMSAMAPVAEAHDNGRGRGGDWRYHDGRHHGGYRHYRRDDHGDAVAAGVVGLILGLAIASAANTPRRGGACYDRCEGPPPPQYQGYDPGDPGSAYAQDYGMAPPKNGGYPQSRQCTRSERQWDRYANRYVTVDVPC